MEFITDDDLESFIQYIGDIQLNDNWPLRTAAARGAIRIVTYLLDNGAPVNVMSDMPLRCAVQRNRYNMVELLLSRGANVHAEGLMDFLAKNNGLAMMQLLVAHNAHFKDDNIITIAATHGHIDIVKYLIDKCDKSHFDEALRIAIKNEHVDIIHALIEHVNIDDHDMNSVYFIGARHDTSLLEKYFINGSMEIKTELFKAAIWASNDTAVAFMITKGVQPNICNGLAIRLATRLKATKVLKVLAN